MKNIFKFKVSYVDWIGLCVMFPSWDFNVWSLLVDSNELGFQYNCLGLCKLYGSRRNNISWGRGEL